MGGSENKIPYFNMKLYYGCKTDKITQIIVV